jgi:signal transduction histidine kinase
MMVTSFETALNLSKSDSSHERLLSARYFMNNVSVEHEVELKAWLARETVGWVKSAIEIALSKNSDTQILETSSDTTESDRKSESYTLALRDVASIMLHELEPRIGLLSVKIRNDVPNYEESASRREMDHLKQFFHALGCLRSATEMTKLESFTFSELIGGLIEDVAPLKNIRLNGPQSTIMKADLGLLKLALSNGIRNAVESTASASELRATDNIVISWGDTNVDHWVAIIDEGMGLGKPIEKLIKIGNTTKPGHFGMGLTIAQQAMQTLNGKLSLTSPNPTGAVFELRWFK